DGAAPAGTADEKDILVEADAPPGAGGGAEQTGDDTGFARWAAAAAFMITGIVFASYFVRVPTLKLEHGLSEGQLGLALMAPTLAALITMQLTGGLVARFGSAPIVRIA